MLWFFILALVVILLLAYQAYAAKNHLDPNAPCYSGRYAGEQPHPVGAITVVTYNIAYALHLDRAIAEIEQIVSMMGLDILLLQEMNEIGVDQIASELRLNYIYYPAAVEPTYHQNFGNAVLSRWPIVDSRKLILPHKSFSNRMKRVAARATIRIHQEDVLAYSIHTEPVFTLPQFKVDQYTAVLSNFASESGRIIVGGDFNTFTAGAVKKIEGHYRRAGLERASQGIGSTFVRWGLEMTPDHIFAKGFAVQDNGRLEGAAASDHLPIWVRLTLK